MKKIIIYFLVTLITLFLSIGIHSQGNNNKSSELNRNSINGYISLFEYNINYERNIIQLPKSYSNLRLGFGLFNSGVDGGYYYNPSLVYVIGQKNKHLEFDLGFKYAVQKGFANSFLPDIYGGYRYEKPSGGIIFRMGIDLYTLFNIGIGIKF